VPRCRAAGVVAAREGPPSRFRREDTSRTHRFPAMATERQHQTCIDNHECAIRILSGSSFKNPLVLRGAGRPWSTAVFREFVTSGPEPPRKDGFLGRTAPGLAGLAFRLYHPSIRARDILRRPRSVGIFCQDRPSDPTFQNAFEARPSLDRNEGHNNTGPESVDKWDSGVKRAWLDERASGRTRSDNTVLSKSCPLTSTYLPSRSRIARSFRRIVGRTKRR
jgi:hypothetical protein